MISRETHAEYISKFMNDFYKMVESELKKHVGSLSSSDIVHRCRKASRVDSPCTETYYLDDKALFKTELVFSGNVFIAKITKPNEGP